MKIWDTSLLETLIYSIVFFIDESGVTNRRKMRILKFSPFTCDLGTSGWLYRFYEVEYVYWQPNNSAQLHLSLEI